MPILKVIFVLARAKIIPFNVPNEPRSVYLVQLKNYLKVLYAIHGPLT